ncbi:MAG: antibiotic biosynthesis monooxygenase [Gammaproteobacteria bacterium]
MITRVWHGWAHQDAAQPYSELLRKRILPEFKRIRGYLGAYVFRRASSNAETEFTVLTMFKDIDAAQQLAGDGGGQALVPPAARTLLSRYDQQASDYEVVTTPKQAEHEARLQRTPVHRIEWNW